MGWAYAQMPQRNVSAPQRKGEYSFSHVTVRELEFNGWFLPVLNSYLIVHWGLSEALAFFQATGDKFLILQFILKEYWRDVTGNMKINS